MVGRHARLELRFGRRRGRTVLTRAYAEPPFRVGRSFEVDGALYLMIVCTGPGVFAGDNLTQTVTVESGARVLLASQSALQLHPGRSCEPARIDHRYLIEDEGELHCHWDPSIPFAGARVRQRFDLQCTGASRLYWSDALMSGRCSRGEAWKFRELAYEFRLSIDGSLQYLERYDLQADDRAVEERWRAGGANYVGTSVVCHGGATARFAEQVQRRLEGIERVSAAVDLVEAGLVVGRFLTRSGPPFTEARGAFRTAALSDVFQAPNLVARR